MFELAGWRPPPMRTPWGVFEARIHESGASSLSGVVVSAGRHVAVASSSTTVPPHRHSDSGAKGIGQPCLFPAIC